MTLGHVVGTQLKRSVKAAKLKQKLELKAWTSVLIYTLVSTEFDRLTL